MYVGNSNTFDSWVAETIGEFGSEYAGGLYSPINTISGITDYNTGVLQSSDESLVWHVDPQCFKIAIFQ